MQIPEINDFAIDNGGHFNSEASGGLLQESAGDRFAVGQRKIANASRIVMNIHIIKFFPLGKFADIGAVGPETTGRIGCRTILLVDCMKQIVEIVQQFFHPGIIVLPDLVAETVGADARMRIGVPDSLHRSFSESRTKRTVLPAGSKSFYINHFGPAS